MLGRIVIAVSLTLLMAATAFADTKALERVFLERAAVAAADQRCHLFSDSERFALRAGLSQSRNELLRNNYRADRIDAVAADARDHVGRLACDTPAIRDTVATIRDSFRQFAKTNYLEFPSAHGYWGASRIVRDQWAVMEADSATRVALGLRRGGPPQAAAFALPRQPGADDATDLRFAVALPAGDWPVAPASVQIRIRDAAKLSEPWLGSVLGASTRLAAPPRSVSRSEWAGFVARENDITNQPFLVYYFPPAIVARLDALDPREGVEIEVTPSPRAPDTRPRTYLFEIGDFSAAFAFALIPQPKVTASADAH